MPRYLGIISTPRPREEAFDYLADFASVAEWDPSVVEAHALDSGPPRVGSRLKVVVRTAGRETPFTYEIEELERPARVVLRAETAAVVSLDTITFAANAAGTDVTYDADLRLKGPLRLLELPMRVAFKRLAENAKAGLERELGMAEAQPEAIPAAS
ncbi:MAG: SRPBCC family protein [bacterium]